MNKLLLIYISMFAFACGGGPEEVFVASVVFAGAVFQDFNLARLLGGHGLASVAAGEQHCASSQGQGENVAKDHALKFGVK